MNMNFIGLSASLNNKDNRQECDLQYVNSIIKTGFYPVIFPYKIDNKSIDEYLDILCGIVLCGGADVSPERYGETHHAKLGQLTPERDELEFSLFNEAMKRNMPILGICRGFQLINAALGGTLYQDFESEHPSEIAHSIPGEEVEAYKKRHKINIVDNTPASMWFDGQEKSVNSFHHQGVNKLASDLIASSYAPDGIVESYYSKKYKNIIAVQWHPEREGNTVSERIFKDFTNLCKEYSRGKNQ